MTSDLRVAGPLDTGANRGRGIGGAIADRAWARLGGWLLLALVVAALVLTVAFQTHPAADIAVGDSVADGTLVRDFNTTEVQPASTDGSRVYRWSKGESSLVFPGIGRTAATVTLTLAGGPNPNAAPQVRLLANGGELTRLTLTPDFADYTVSVPALYLRTGNLTLTLEATPFRAPGDRRELGVLVSHVRVVPATGLALPPARSLLALWGAVALLTLALVVVGLSGVEAAVAGSLTALAVAAGLVTNRLFVTVAAGAWLRVGVATLLLALVLRLVVPRIVGSRQSVVGSESSDARARAYRWLLAVAVMMFAVRLGGLWHPAMIVSDLTFHVHRFDDVVLRHQWYQEIPALYASNRPVPYPPAAYLLFAPFAALVPDHAALLTLGSQLLDSVRVVLVGVVAWRLTGDRVAGACAAFLAGAAPVAFLLFSWGNLTDATGEVALTVVFALLALAWPRLREPPFAVAFVAALLFTLLAHIGVAVTAVAFLGMAVALGIFAAARGRNAETQSRFAFRPVLTLVVLALVAGVLAVALFYRVPLTGAKAAPATDAPPPVVARAVTGYTIGAPRPDATIGLPAVQTPNPLVAIAGQLGEEAWAFYRVWPLVLAPVGVWLLDRPRRMYGQAGAMAAADAVETDPAPAPLVTQYAGLVLTAWLLGALVLLGVGVLSGQFVRYAVSALPAVSVGAGAVLAFCWRWRAGRVGWVGRAVVIALLALMAFATLVMWYGRITRTYHG